MILSVRSTYTVALSPGQGIDEFDVQRFIEDAHRKNPWISRYPSGNFVSSSLSPTDKLIIGEVTYKRGPHAIIVTVTTRPKYYIDSEMMHAYRTYARIVGSAVREQPYIMDVRLSIHYEEPQVSLH